MTPTDILSSAMRTLFILGKEEAEKAAQEERERAFVDYSKIADQKDALEKELELTTEDKERLSQEVDRLETELNSLRADAARDAAMPEQAWPERVRQMQETIDTYEARIKDLTKAYKALQAEQHADGPDELLRMCRETLASKETELKAAQDELDRLRQENARLHLCVPEFRPNPVLDLSKINIKAPDYEKLRERFKNLDDLTTRYTDDKGLEMLRKYLSRDYHPGDYVTGHLTPGGQDEDANKDRFTGIVKNYGDEYVTFHAMLATSGATGRSHLLICSRDHPEAAVLFRSKNITVAACATGVAVKRSEISDIKKISREEAEKLDKVIGRHGFRFDGLLLHGGAWDGVSIVQDADGLLHIED